VFFVLGVNILFFFYVHVFLFLFTCDCAAAPVTDDVCENLILVKSSDKSVVALFEFAIPTLSLEMYLNQF